MAIREGLLELVKASITARSWATSCGHGDVHAFWWACARDSALRLAPCKPERDPFDAFGDCLGGAFGLS